MARQKKLEAPVTLFAAIESEQHQALREIAFEQRRPIADLVRQPSANTFSTLPSDREKRLGGG